jgi:ADP-heptose:LPS heptosyltransferase
LDECLAGHAPDELPPELLRGECAPALFGILAEGLADRFEPALCDAYAHLFSQAVAHAIGGVDAPELEARYRRLRRVRAVMGDPSKVFVLSRVTLGADIAVSSVVLAAAKRRFPKAELVFVGPRKNCELFAADAAITPRPVEYRRGGLSERLAVGAELRDILGTPDGVVLDPDSRLTQLGLLPVCEEEQHHLFESRSYGAGTAATLPELTARWAEETLGVSGSRPYIALAPGARRNPYIAVSLGVGENLAKRLPDPFEERLLRLLADTKMPLLLDRGAGGAEAERVARAAKQSGAAVTYWDGSFAGFASIIAGGRLYIGYDSAGQHVAAAAGVPLVSVFAGFAAPRMYDRWRPSGEKAMVIRVDRPDVEETLVRVQAALAALGLK